jgi:hypothetical protein
VTTLVPDPVVGGHCLRSWTKVYDMLGIPEALQTTGGHTGAIFRALGHVGGQIGKSMRTS